MELIQVRGGQKTELDSKSLNIGVGISLGNKWFTIENTAGLIKWSLPYTKENVIVYVADSIHAINLEVRNRISSEKALTLAKTTGSEYLDKIREHVKANFSLDDQNKIIYATWDDIQDERYREKVNFLYKKFEEDLIFAESIKSIIKNWVVKEERKFSENDINIFATYILEELPECLLRVPIKGEACDAFVYPFDGELPELIEMIQDKLIYPEIMETIADTKPKVLLVVR